MSKKTQTFKPGDKLQITWTDTAVQHGWIDVTAANSHRLSRVESLGFFLSCAENPADKQSYINICQSIDFITDDIGSKPIKNNVAYPQAIPTTSIINVRRLK